MMFKTSSVVATAHASKYLQQLCKHWGHRFEANFGPNQGSIQFGEDGRLELAADEDYLSLTLYNADRGSIESSQDSVEEHVKRFAFKENLEFSWSEDE